jgi:APA family basic amino acid/polyamine antiporter
MATAQDGLLPRFLSKLSRHDTPYWAIIIAALIMTLLLGMNYSKLLTSKFTLLITLSNLCILVPYLYTSIAAMLAFQKFRRPDDKKNFIRSMGIAVLACVYVLFAIIGSGKEIIFYGIVLFFILAPFYAFMRVR